MIVCFDATALADAREAVTRALSQIFELFVEGRHQWCVPDPRNVLSSAWFVGLGQRDQRRVRELLQHAKSVFRVSGSTVRVIVGVGNSEASDGWWLEAERATFVLRQPLRVVLENQSADGAFLRALLFRFGDTAMRRKLGNDEFDRTIARWGGSSAGDGVFFKLIHGGGSDTGKVLAAEWETCPTGCLALVDSDHPIPPTTFAPLPDTTWDKVSKAAGGVVATPNGERPRVVALRRREAENYIPQGALRAQFATQAKAVTAYGALSTQHRAHYDLKQGFRKALEDSQDPAQPASWQWKRQEEAAFWSGQDEDTLRLLHDGFGRAVWECWLQDHRTIHRKALAMEADREFGQIVRQVLEAL